MRHFLRYILIVPLFKYVFIVLSIQIDFRRPVIYNAQLEELFYPSHLSLKSDSV